MTAETQHRARQALAYLAQTLQPDWDPPGIHAAIEALHRDRQMLGVIADHTIDAALDPSAKTPGVIAYRIRNGIRRNSTQPATPTPDRPHACDRCGALTVPGEPHEQHCAPRAQPGARAHHFAGQETSDA